MRADDVMALIRAHAKADRKQFASVALMIAANDAKLWGGSFASEVRRLVNQGDAGGLTPLPRGEEGDSAAVALPPHTLSDLLLSPETADAIGQLLAEYTHADALREGGCEPALKVLFAGPPGTGKTAAAGAVAAALGVPFVVARQHQLIGSHLGDSEKNVARLFDFAAANRAVVLLDEFDALGSARGDIGTSAGKSFNNIVTAVLQLFDRHIGPALLIATTNRQDVLDPAVVRRFDVIVPFGMPTESDRRELIRRTLGDDDGPYCGSHADIVRDCRRERKRRMLAALASTGGRS